MLYALYVSIRGQLHFASVQTLDKGIDIAIHTNGWQLWELPEGTTPPEILSAEQQSEYTHVC